MTSATKTELSSSRLVHSHSALNDVFTLRSQIGEESKAASLGIVDLPALVYFESNVPHLYKGDLRYEIKLMSVKRVELCFRVERDVLDWLLEQLTTDEIEEVIANFAQSLTHVLIHF